MYSGTFSCPLGRHKTYPGSSGMFLHTILSLLHFFTYCFFPIYHIFHHCPHTIFHNLPHFSLFINLPRLSIYPIIWLPHFTIYLVWPSTSFFDIPDFLINHRGMFILWFCIPVYSSLPNSLAPPVFLSSCLPSY